MSPHDSKIPRTHDALKIRNLTEHRYGISVLCSASNDQLAMILTLGATSSRDKKKMADSTASKLCLLLVVRSLCLTLIKSNNNMSCQLYIGQQFIYTSHQLQMIPQQNIPCFSLNFYQQYWKSQNYLMIYKDFVKFRLYVIPLEIIWEFIIYMHIQCFSVPDLCPCVSSLWCEHSNARWLFNLWRKNKTNLNFWEMQESAKSNMYCQSLGTTNPLWNC